MSHKPGAQGRIGGNFWPFRGPKPLFHRLPSDRADRGGPRQANQQRKSLFRTHIRIFQTHERVPSCGQEAQYARLCSDQRQNHRRIATKLNLHSADYALGVFAIGGWEYIGAGHGLCSRVAGEDWSSSQVSLGIAISDCAWSRGQTRGQDLNIHSVGLGRALRDGGQTSKGGNSSTSSAEGGQLTSQGFAQIQRTFRPKR
jgi:hypothetical protein